MYRAFRKRIKSAAFTFFGLVSVSLLTIFSLLACKKQIQPKYPEYDWSVTESAPKEYPVRIIDGDFEALDGYHKGIPTRVILYNGWGDGRSQMAIGRDEMPIPKSMAVTWYSYREDTFYRGEFALPTEEISQLFEASKKPQPFSGIIREGGSFVVGLAPEGYVAVWVQGLGFGRVVFTGFAKPVTDVPEEVIFSYPDMTKEQVREMIINNSLEDAKGSPNIDNPKYWQQLHNELYQYEFVIESPYRPYDVSVTFLDKTSDSFYGNELNEFSKIRRSVSTAFAASFLFPARDSLASVSLKNSEELYSAFRHLSKAIDAGRIRFVVKIEGDLYNWRHQISIHVANDKESIAIKDFEFSRHGGADIKEYFEHNKHMHRFINQPVEPAPM